MPAVEKWKSLKVRASQYQALAACSEKTGRPILKLGEEALRQFITSTVPIYNRHADQARAAIDSRTRQAVKKMPKRTLKAPVETVSIPA